jgi:hypothetical protein
MNKDEQDLSNLFHKLWTKAVGTIDPDTKESVYDKKEWERLAAMLRERGVIV